MRLRSLGLSLLLLVACASLALAEVRLPALFSDNAVFQRGVPVQVWGWAAPDELVSVSFAGQTVRTTALADGTWKLQLNAMPAGGPYDLTANRVTVKNILVGEVWIASGQSNMQWNVQGAMNSTEEIAAADYPKLRMFTVPNVIAATPQTDCKGSWAICSPQTVARFSAVGYFFGRELFQALNVPIGIIHTSWGGTPAQAWTDEQTLLDNPALKPMADGKNQGLASYANAAFTAMSAWLPQASAAQAAGKPLPLPPTLPPDPRASPGMPTGLYNAMIAPLIPYSFQGAIWYQGESNAGNPAQYRVLFPAMIQGWRRNWGQGDFPFLFVQLANYMSTHEQPTDTQWAQLREAQALTLSLPNTGMAVTIDIGTPNNIHPPNKQEVGRRLALWARHLSYGQDLVYSGPLYKSMVVEGKTIRLRFDHVGGGLVAKGGPLKGFAIAGADGRFVWADATIDGETVVVQSPEVAAPIAVRYAWDDNPVCNLYNQEGLPASPFRTDMPR